MNSGSIRLDGGLRNDERRDALFIPTANSLANHRIKANVGQRFFDYFLIAADKTNSPGVN